MTEIRSMLNSLLALAEDAVSSPYKKINELCIVPEDEKSLLESFNCTPHEYAIPSDTTLYSLFERTARENTDKICIHGAEKAVTFGELPDFYADDNGDFTVLQFTDTHFTTMTSLSDLFLLEKMKAQTEKYSPDLVVMTGDMIDDGNDGDFNKAEIAKNAPK